MSFSVALVKLHWFGINWHVLLLLLLFFSIRMQKLLLVYYYWENRAIRRIWKVLPNMVFAPIWGGGGGEMAALWACACKLPWTLFSPAWVQPLYGTGRKESSGTELGLPMVFSSFASTDTLTNKERDSTFELSATDCTDFELLVSAGEELVWKYKSFDFTVEWFADFELFASCESTVLWFDS